MKRVLLVSCGVVFFASLFVVCGVLYGHLREGARGWYRQYLNSLVIEAIEALPEQERASQNGCTMALRVEREKVLLLLEQRSEIARVLRAQTEGGSVYGN